MSPVLLTALDFAHRRHEVGRLDSEHLGKRVDRLERGVLLAVLAATDVGAIEPCLVGKGLLRPAESLAVLSHPLTESDVCIPFFHHASSRSACDL